MYVYLVVKHFFQSFLIKSKNKKMPRRSCIPRVRNKAFRIFNETEHLPLNYGRVLSDCLTVGKYMNNEIGKTLVDNVIFSKALYAFPDVSCKILSVS